MYLQAGSDLITTNTFGANRLKYGEELEKIVSEAVSHAKEAVRAEGHGYVAWIWVLRESFLSLLAIWSLKMRLRFIRKPYHMEPERERPGADRNHERLL